MATVTHQLLHCPFSYIPHDALVLLGLEKAAASSKRTPTERTMAVCKLAVVPILHDVWICGVGAVKNTSEGFQTFSESE